jgi:hypothetical protein
VHNNLLSSLHLIVSPLLVCNLNSIVVSLCRRQSPAAAIVVTVVVRVLQPQTTFFWWNQGKLGIARKLSSPRARRFSHCTDAATQKWKRNGKSVPTFYIDRLIVLDFWLFSFYWVVLMPVWFLCPSLYHIVVVKSINEERKTERSKGFCGSLSCSISHPPHSSASPVELRLRVGPRTLSGKKWT